MKTNKLLMIGVGMVVLYVLYKKFYATESEETAGAWGRPSIQKSEAVPCSCQGQFIGNMSARACRRHCRKAHNVNKM